MGFRINNNISALVSQGNLTKTQRGIAQSIERLSSGLRINRGADDAAGLTISEKLRGQIKGLNRAIGNSQDGISLLQTAEGALNENAAILNRLRELAIQSQADSLTTNDRLEIQKEVDQLIEEIDRTSSTTEFNTKKLLDGNASAKVSTSSSGLKVFQLGSGDVAAGDYVVTVSLEDGGTKQVQKSSIQTLDSTGNKAALTTKLGELTSMFNSFGKSLLEISPGSDSKGKWSEGGYFHFF
jgi:flagellin